MFKKVAIMQEKGKFAKIKGIICNVPVETDTVCNVLSRPVSNNGLIIVKLKSHLRYPEYAYFGSVCPSVIYEALNYLKRKKIMKIFPFPMV